jgi:hypothetical protein
MKALLVKLRIFDADETLAVSNLVLFILTAKVAAAQNLSVTDLIAFLLVLLNYNAKKVFRFLSEKRTEAVERQLSVVELKLKELQAAVGFKQIGKQ